MTTAHLHRGHRAFTLPALALAMAGLAAPVHAETSPYYVGVSQALAYDSNLYRLGNDQATPAAVRKRGDMVSTTSLVGGIDQPIGRQRVYGSASLRATRFASNDSLNNTGYGFNLGVDWETINRISGRVTASANRNLRAFDPNEATLNRLEKNIETVQQLEATARIGVVTQVTAEAGLNWRKVGYTAAAYNTSEYDQTGASLGLRYRLGGATTLGAGLRVAKARYGGNAGQRDNQNLDLTVDWVPSGLTNVFGRLSYGRSESSVSTLTDVKGFTGEMRARWQATGKIGLTARLLRDTGQESAFQSANSLVVASNDFSRTTTIGQLNADYALSAKIAMNAGVQISQRNLNNSQFNLFTGLQTLDGSDTTTTLSLGARWSPTRTIQIGCDLVREQRSVSSNLSLPYVSNGASCSGQFTLR